MKFLCTCVVVGFATALLFDYAVEARRKPRRPKQQRPKQQRPRRPSGGPVRDVGGGGGGGKKIDTTMVQGALAKAIKEETAQGRKQPRNPVSRDRQEKSRKAHTRFGVQSAHSFKIQQKANFLVRCSLELHINEDLSGRGRDMLAPGTKVTDLDKKIKNMLCGDKCIEASVLCDLEKNKRAHKQNDGIKFKKNMLPGDNCIEASVLCDLENPYRTISGHCNNLQNPDWGAAFSPFLRFLPPVYQDGINSPRSKSVDGSALTSARTVSARTGGQTSVQDSRRTHMVMQWGQFLDHDLGLTPQSTGFYGGPVICNCDARFRIPDCFPIPVERTDRIFGGAMTCMNFVRSQAGQLRLGPREQLNQITSYIDASNVYGSEVELARSLRTLRGGQMKLTENGLLPRNPADNECEGTNGCFAAGDERVNEQAGLSSMHTLWVRHHNALATDLKRRQRSWNDEKLYQETRRIVGALHQHITYREFLPSVLNKEFLEKYSLRGRFKGYNSRCDATLKNGFAAAAFRFGHSLIRSRFDLRNSAFHSVFNLTGHFFDAGVLHQEGFRGCQAFLEGMSGQKGGKRDKFVTTSMRDHLFGTGANGDGLDIVALNIQRGRDHGLPAYVHWRKLFGLSVPRSFNDLNRLMDTATVRALKAVYKKVKDIDLFPAILAENAVRGGLLGEVGSNIIGSQFRALRHCDRFFYENTGQPGSFTRKQLSAIKRSSLSRVICQHVQAATSLPARAFVQKNKNRLTCKPGQHKSIDLSAWGPRTRTGRRRRAKKQKMKMRPRCLSATDKTELQ